MANLSTQPANTVTTTGVSMTRSANASHADVGEMHDEEVARAREALLRRIVALHRARLAFLAFEPSGIHWKCRDCFLPCSCVGEIMRSLPHKRCGNKQRWDHG